MANRHGETNRIAERVIATLQAHFKAVEDKLFRVAFDAASMELTPSKRESNEERAREEAFYLAMDECTQVVTDTFNDITLETEHEHE